MRSPKFFRLSTLFFATTIAAYACWLIINWSQSIFLAGLVVFCLLSILSFVWPLRRCPTSWRWTLRCAFIVHLTFVFSIGPAFRYVAIVNRPPTHDIELKMRFVKTYHPILDWIWYSSDLDKGALAVYVKWWLPRDIELQIEDDGIIGRYTKPNGGLNSKYLYWRNRLADG